MRSDELGREITELCGYIYAATYQLLVKIHEFDRDGLWKLSGICSCAHWLNWQCGIGMNAAREKLRVANALADLPKISEAFSRGEVSYSKVRAMTRVATPENESYLMSIAQHGTAHHVESLVSQYRRARRLNGVDNANDQYRDRYLDFHYDDDGSLTIKGRFPAEQGAMIMKVLQQAMDRVEAEDKEAEEEDDLNVEDEAGRQRRKLKWINARVPISVQRADALAEVAESYLGHGPTSSGSADRYQVMLHVSAETLTEGGVTAETSGLDDQAVSHLEDGPHVSAETSRRICCDSSISTIMTDKKGEPLAIGRKSRVIPAPMRRALQARDDGCRFPGCTHKHFIDGHHIRHWADGGETGLDNLVLLCRHHPRLVHEGGFACERSGNGQLIFRNQNGDLIGISGTVPHVTAETQTAGAIKRIHDRLEELHIHADTCSSNWGGEKMDHDIAVGIIWDIDMPNWDEERLHFRSNENG